MTKTFTLILFVISFLIFGQNTKLSDAEINTKLDSIKQEGNLLYSLENASWQSGDLKNENRKIKNLAGKYLTYKSNDTIKTVFLDKGESKVIAEYSFLNNSKKTCCSII